MGHWVRRVYHEITIHTNEVLRPYGLARSQWEVLYRIAGSDSPDGITQKELQTTMKVESGTLTGIVDSLVKKGWLVREEHPSDRRIKRLKMTHEGHQSWVDIPNPIEVLRPQMMNGITSEEEAFVVKLLQKAVLNLNLLDNEGESK
ncbi:MarR family winged helix-turn-helix transcriptional regulator [Alicyclobacillus sp. SO9]|uniref:MarR family winged helix-turn-helix transcriptional regulator n=1 Tax=Alicyclobacillus sp. SO9 TaxID=2665646 RepID=UPI0018E73034|nr:MarR family transcriptional regulator [Alicyclobacillus sp. SO9]QQE78797.1 MarR family transcriptional regulator [Alicyclobacillus sp. SO9]